MSEKFEQLVALIDREKAEMEARLKPANERYDAVKWRSNPKTVEEMQRVVFDRFANGNSAYLEYEAAYQELNSLLDEAIAMGKRHGEMLEAHKQEMGL